MPSGNPHEDRIERERLDELSARYEESRAKLEAVISCSDDAVIISDTDGNIVDANAAAAKLYGLDDAGGLRNVGDFFRLFEIEKPDGCRLSPDEQPIHMAMRGETFSGYELVAIRKDTGRMSIWSCSGSPIRNRRYQAGLAMLTIRDVTEERNTRKALLEAKALSEEYLDLMSHDINNMNQIALGYLELAGEVLPVSTEDRELLRKPYDMLRRSSRLIEDVRTIRETRYGIRLELVDIGKVLRDVRDRHGNPDRVRIDTGGVPATVCWTMASEYLHDMFSHIVCYAIARSGGRPLEISMSVRKATRNGQQYYDIEIEDNGPGMTDGHKELIFDRAGREEDSLKGGGIGLYLACVLAESYKGSVRVEDRITGDCAEGCRFIVTLPSADD